MNESRVDDSDLWQRLAEIFRETLDEPDIVLSRETTASDIEGWDSITNIQLLVAIEQALSVKFRTGEIAGLANVGELFEIIVARVQG